MLDTDWLAYPKEVTFEIAGNRTLQLFAYNDRRAIAWGRGEFCDAAFLERMANLISPGSRVIDCGANVGNHAIYFGQYDFQVEAIEAHPRIFEALRYNCRSLQNIRCHNVALWSENDFPLDFETSRNPGETKVFPSFAGSISSRKLDSLGFENDVSLVKIDVEGSELEVLAGAANLLKEQHPILCVEVHHPITDSQVIEHLAQYGYESGRDLFLS